MLFSRRSCMMTHISYSHDGSFIHIRKRTQCHSLPEINLNINFKALNRKTKPDTNPIPDLTDTGGAVLTLLLGYRSFIHLSEHRKRVYIELL